jgi:hypothetical protein
MKKEFDEQVCLFPMPHFVLSLFSFFFFFFSFSYLLLPWSCQLQPIYLLLIKKASSHIRPSVAYGLAGEVVFAV